MHSRLLLGLSKLANILHIKELQRRLASEGYNNITCISLHPGTVFTPAVKKFCDDTVPYLGWLVSDITKMISLDEMKGSWTPSFAAAGVEIQNNRVQYKGAYLTPWKRIENPATQAQSEALAKELWETTESILRDLKL
jgi:NAD(P)-dependent dehydrogenase (short-subunit alcohol dehydrogenase family)